MVKKALCVGISRFNNPAIPPLAGCEHDALMMANVLVDHFDFRAGGTRVLTNENATKDAIVRRLRWLVDDANDGDVLVFSFSSHGTWRIDRSDADDPNHELDGRDEVLVPFDYSEENCLVDNEIATILDQLEDGARLYCIIDTCHSGTMTRDFPNVGQPNITGPTYGAPYPAFSPILGNNLLSTVAQNGHGLVQNRFFPPTLDIVGRSLGNYHWKENSRRLSTEDNMNRLSISGCKDNEQSLDIPTANGNRGLMTSTLCRVLEDQKWRGKSEAIFNDVQAKVSAFAATMHHSQTPQIHGPEHLRDQLIFR